MGAASWPRCPPTRPVIIHDRPDVCRRRRRSRLTVRAALSPKRIHSMSDQTTTVVRAKGVLDVDLGEVLEGASIVIEGNHITSVTDTPPSASDVDQVIDLPDL